MHSLQATGRGSGGRSACPSVLTPWPAPGATNTAGAARHPGTITAGQQHPSPPKYVPTRHPGTRQPEDTDARPPGIRGQHAAGWLL
eukprot:10386962-Alexandrium_andersonii.AAC.1